jgi:hypothetical protein
MVKDMGQRTGKTTCQSNFMNDNGIPSTLAASDLMDITGSQIILSLTVANENSGTLFLRDTVNSPAPFRKGLVKENCSNAQHPSQH